MGEGGGGVAKACFDSQGNSSGMKENALNLGKQDSEIRTVSRKVGCIPSAPSELSGDGVRLGLPRTFLIVIENLTNYLSTERSALSCHS